jgi:membrane-associated protein
MDLIQHLIDALIHLSPDSINAFIAYVGPTLFYCVLTAIIFAETGLVVAPFLPGDSLLFAVGAVSASAGSPIRLDVTAVLLVIAAILGDAVNYAIGYVIGPKVFSRENSRLLNKEHLLHAHNFYEKYGAVTIILARFMPIVRTFAPFVAGIARMTYPKFALYNIIGGVAWVVLFLFAGYQFGALPAIQRNFHLVIFAIIGISVLPPIIEAVRVRLRKEPKAS